MRQNAGFRGGERRCEADLCHAQRRRRLEGSPRSARLRFSLYEREELAVAHALSYDVHVCGGETDTVRVSNAEACYAVLAKAHGKITMTVELPRFLYAGVEEGDAVGTVRFLRMAWSLHP